MSSGIQLSAYKDYALENGLIGQPLHDLMEAVRVSEALLPHLCKKGLEQHLAASHPCTCLEPAP